MDVRPAVVGDAEAIGKVVTRSWQVAYRGILPDELLDAISWERRADGWRRNITEASVLVATQEDSVVGFIATGPAWEEPEATQLYAIYLLPDVWGTGAGAKLVSAALTGVPHVLLWVFADNPRARRFYERQGFATDGVTRVETYGGREVTEIRYARVLPAEHRAPAP